MSKIPLFDLNIIRDSIRESMIGEFGLYYIDNLLETKIMPNLSKVLSDNRSKNSDLAQADI